MALLTRVFVFVGLLWSLAAQARALPEPDDYLLGAGDVVKIVIYDHADMTTEATVAASGQTRLPLLGEIAAAGLTTSALEAAIALRLQEGALIREASVNIMVLQYRSQQVTVIGQVTRPGKYPLQRRSNVIDLIATAGGITPSGADTVVLIRGDSARATLSLNDLATNSGLDGNVPVQNGDTIYVNRAPVFYIYGEVQRPGAYRLERNMTMVQALSAGGGLTPKGTQRGLTVMRPGSGVTPGLAPGAAAPLQKVRVNLGDLLQADDTVYVQESLF